MQLFPILYRAALATVLCAAMAAAKTVPPLLAAGYTVLPQIQQATLTGAEFEVGRTWHLQIGKGVGKEDVSIEALREGFQTRHGLHLSDDPVAGPAITLSIVVDSVKVGTAQDADRVAISAQAYQIRLSGQGIFIESNGAEGLFYGVETLVQLVRHRNGSLSLPEGEIVDWPDLQLRELYWDDAHHLDRIPTLKQSIRQAAFFKINGFVIKLEGHFQFKSAPAVVEPCALSPGEFQELTDYARKYHVQLIPYLDAPAHVTFILKHPEYARLRAFADSNYEMCATNPDSLTLICGMFQDLIDANKGGKYIYLSTDEPYYIGMADNAHCSEAARKKELGSVGKVLAEFVTKAGDYLHDRDRTVIFWGEYPLKPADVATLPPYLVNGETNEPEFDAAFKARGIRQMMYTSTEGEEKLFPGYFQTPTERRLHAGKVGRPRIEEAMESIVSDAAREHGDLMGILVAGWADMGLHPETFWLGYATITSAGWNPAAADAPQARAAFYRLFYGPSAQNMDRVYELLCMQAQSWEDSWETGPSESRKGIWGNSNSIYQPRHPAHDQTFPLPPAPKGDNLIYDSNWIKDNARRLQLAERSMADNNELLRLLHDNLLRVEFNTYNLEVFLSIAYLCRQNLEMIEAVGEMDSLLTAARDAAAAGKKPEEAVAKLDAAIATANRIRDARDGALRDAMLTWRKSWYPRVAEANGRKFLHEVDDVKDHLPDRTLGMQYLVYRETQMPMERWVEGIQAARNEYAKAHGLGPSVKPFDWSVRE